MIPESILHRTGQSSSLPSLLLPPSPFSPPSRPLRFISLSLHSPCSDPTEQRLYITSIFVLIQAYKLYTFLFLSSSLSSLPRLLLLDAVFILGVPLLRVPRLTYDRKTRWTLVLVIGTLDWLVFGGWRSVSPRQEFEELIALSFPQLSCSSRSIPERESSRPLFSNLSLDTLRIPDSISSHFSAHLLPNALVNSSSSSRCDPS